MQGNYLLDIYSILCESIYMEDQIEKHVKDYNRAYYEANKEKISARKKAWYIANKDRIRSQQKAYVSDNKEKIQADRKIYYKANKKRIIEGIRIWQKANKNKNKDKDKMKAYRSFWTKQKRQTDPKFRLNCCVSSAIKLSLKENKNGRPWTSLVGYTLDDLKKHLEKQFTKGMTWENCGKWHIDHKIPISVFNFTSPEHEDFKRCWALSNLQPLWAAENISKFNKIDKHFQPSLLL